MGSISGAFQSMVHDAGLVLSTYSMSSFVTNNFLCISCVDPFLRRIGVRMQTGWKEMSDVSSDTLPTITATCPSQDCCTLIQSESFCDEGNLSCIQRIWHQMQVQAEQSGVTGHVSILYFVMARGNVG